MPDAMLAIAFCTEPHQVSSMENPISIYFIV